MFTPSAEIFRQASQSLIVMNAHAVNQGELPRLTATDRDFFFLRRRDPAAAVKTIQELCQTRLPKNMGIQPSDIQVLSPSRKHEAGTRALNLALQAVLNVAVVTNTIPNTGISLPFFSSGGTSLMMLLGEMGIVLSVSRGET